MGADQEKAAVRICRVGLCGGCGCGSSSSSGGGGGGGGGGGCQRGQVRGLNSGQAVKQRLNKEKISCCKETDIVVRIINSRQMVLHGAYISIVCCF